MKKVVVITLIIILTVLLLVFLGFENLNLEPTKKIELQNDIFKEFVKYFIQFIFIALGAGILVSEYNRSRQRKQDLKSFRKEIYKSLVDVYLKTKRIRWILRTNCKNHEINYQLYKGEMDKIIDVKSSLEIIIHEIKAYSKPFENIENKLKGDLDKMEDYLRELLKEFYEAPQIVGSPERINTTSLPIYEKFISTVSKEQNLKEFKSEFTLNYRAHFYDALELLKQNELKMIDPITSKYLYA